jgi:Ion transport protein
LVDLAAYVAEHPIFINFVTFVILIASVEVGKLVLLLNYHSLICQSDERYPFTLSEKYMYLCFHFLLIGVQTDEILSLQIIKFTDMLDISILAIFTLEVGVKLVAEGATFWNYFNSSWNKFDFFIVAASYLPTGSGSMLMILRLLRLLRVLKLLRAFPRLQVIVEALMKGVTSIFYIGVILFIWVYFYAILGMIFFSAIDPWHFGTLHMAMMSLFQMVTLDGWTTVMQINMYGCFFPQWSYGEGKKMRVLLIMIEDC